MQVARRSAFGALCNMEYLSETHIKSREDSFAHNLLRS